MVNPFEETIIAGDVSLTPHDRVQQERDLRIGEAANMYMNTNVTNPTQEATRYVDWKYPTVFGELTPGKSGHPYEGGWGPEHKWARSTDLGYNPLKHILDYSINTVKPAIRDVMGFPQPSWVDEYTDRDVPSQHEAYEKRLNDIRRRTDEVLMHPLFPGPGPWNEFDPHSKFEEYIDNMNMDEGGSEWSPSEEYLGGTSDIANNLHPDEHIYPIYVDYMMNFPGTKPYIGFEEWKQEVYPYLDVGIDSTLSRT
jgi:hypothetical protein